MANPTTNYGFVLPTPTDLVTDLPADFEVALQGVDTQMKTNADAAIAKTIVDAKGDLIAGTGSDTVSRLAVGTNDQVLIADSTTATGLKWGSPSAGGMTLISTTSLSGTTTTISSIPQTYNSLFLIVSGVTTSAGNDEAFTCSPNNVGNLCNETGVTNSSVSASTGGQVQLSGGQSTWRTSSNNVWTLQFDNYTSTTRFKTYELYGGFQIDGSSFGSTIRGGAFRSNTAITSLVFNYATSNMNGGSVLLYGVK